MQSFTTANLAPLPVFRERCYSCFRPPADCFCAAIPRIDNRTEVLILQHVRERFHPFNTARIVHRALRNSNLHVVHPRDRAAIQPLRPGAALLYPGARAALLSELPRELHPAQLVILDGTWHHTKTMLRDLPALAELPRYRLAPLEPGRYRIRREPGPLALSTVEAAVAALSALEPHTPNLDQLLAAFDAMVERQLAHPKAEYGWRRNLKRTRDAGNIPRAILDDLDHVVVAYGESAAGQRGPKRVAQAPVYWVAERVGTGERFTCAIQTGFPISDSLLGHLELTREELADSRSMDEVRAAWAAFRRPGDTVAVYNQGSARLLAQIADDPACLIMKSVDFDKQQRYATLDELIAARGLAVPAPHHPGRAGKRLANLLAFVRYLNTLGNLAV